MFRIVELSRRGISLGLRDDCMIVTDDNSDPAAIPLKELSAVLLSEPALTISGAILSALAEHRIPLVICDRRGMPTGLLSCVSSNAAGADRVLRAQFDQSMAVKGRLWRKLIRGKIEGQAKVLNKWRGSRALVPLIRLVQNGDPENIEGRASAIYWRKLGVFERRSRCRDDANAFFNYAYTILYSAFAREIAIAGLLPRIGVFHHCRDNAFPLASDLMEPFRPAVDDVVLTVLNNFGNGQLNSELKKHLLEKLYALVFSSPETAGTTSLFQAVRMSVQSYKRVLLTGRCSKFCLPEWREVKKCG